MNNDKILLAHGGGGQLSDELVRHHILPKLKNDTLAELADSAKLNLATGSICFTTDSYVVKPLFFNGGDIGKLAVCGTVNDLAVATGLGQTFVGSIFIAISTSLPEAVVSFSAFKFSIDMAIGNILGSNITDLFFLPIYDVIFLKGPIFAFSHQNQLLNVISAIIMTAIFGLMLKFQKPLLVILGNLTMILIYFLNLSILYYLR